MQNLIHLRIPRPNDNAETAIRANWIGTASHGQATSVVMFNLAQSFVHAIDRILNRREDLGSICGDTYRRPKRVGQLGRQGRPESRRSTQPRCSRVPCRETGLNVGFLNASPGRPAGPGILAVPQWRHSSHFRSASTLASGPEVGFGRLLAQGSPRQGP